MAYKITELSDLNDDFRRCFGTGFKQFYDQTMSLACSRLMIDIVAFDEWLHKEHGDYESKNKSLSDIIFQHYGDEAAALIDELI